VSPTNPLLEKAQRSFDAAEALLERGDTDFAVSRAYYGFFYVAQAMLRSEGVDPSSHGQVIGQYGLLFARTRRMDPQFHRLLNRAFQLRQGADYQEAEFALETAEVQEIIDGGRRFLAAATEYLTSRA
jgi:uncharacterized protein (UPF0332 family)